MIKNQISSFKIGGCSVSKEIEEIKSVFYQKLNIEKEKEKNPEESEVQLENKLHPLIQKAFP